MATQHTHSNALRQRAARVLAGGARWEREALRECFENVDHR